MTPGLEMKTVPVGAPGRCELEKHVLAFSILGEFLGADEPSHRQAGARDFTFFHRRNRLEAGLS